MPLTTTTYTIHEEINRLEQRREEIAAETAQTEEGTDRFQNLVDEGVALDSQLNGLRWAAREWGEDATITVGGLTKGEKTTVDKRVHHDDQQFRRQLSQGRRESQSTSAADPGQSVHTCAMGLRDAPPVPDAASDHDKFVQIVKDLPVEFCGWLERRINELTTVRDEGNSKSFAELVAEKRAASTTDT
jgi:hypothetical protein